MKHAQHARPLLFGCLGGALAPTLVLTVMVFLSPERAAFPASMVAIVTFPIFLVGCVAAGLPVALALRSKGQLSVIPLCLAGIFLGSVVTFLFTLPVGGLPEPDDALLSQIAWMHAVKGAAYGSALGLMASAGFCLGAGIRIRPSRTPHVTPTQREF